MEFIDKIERIAAETGFTQWGWLDVDQLNYYPEVRKPCEGNTCRGYGASWACPPAVGTLAECAQRVGQYHNMLLFSRAYRLEDSFDFEGMVESLHSFKKLVDAFQDNLGGILTDYLLLSNEGCGRCAECTYPDGPCRFPERLHHSLEGYGFVVNELARGAGIRYNNGTNTVTYFGALLFGSEGRS